MRSSPLRRLNPTYTSSEFHAPYNETSVKHAEVIHEIARDLQCDVAKGIKTTYQAPDAPAQRITHA